MSFKQTLLHVAVIHSFVSFFSSVCSGGNKSNGISRGSFLSGEKKFPCVKHNLTLLGIISDLSQADVFASACFFCQEVIYLYSVETMVGS